MAIGLGAKNEQCIRARKAGSSTFYLLLHPGHPLGLIFLFGNDFDAAVTRHPGPGGDQMADDDVLLQTAEMIGHPEHGSLSENTSCLLERRRGDEALGGERSLRNPKQQRLIGGRLPTLRLDAPLLDPELGLVDLLPFEEVRVAWILDPDLLEHLPDDDLDVLVV